MMKIKKSEIIDKKRKTVNVPILNIRMMSDEEWNRLAYKNAMERKAVTA